MNAAHIFPTIIVKRGKTEQGAKRNAAPIIILNTPLKIVRLNILVFSFMQKIRFFLFIHNMCTNMNIRSRKVAKKIV